MTRRLAAVAALVLVPAAVTLAILEALRELPRGLIGLAGILAALGLIWFGALRRGAIRITAVGAGLLLLAGGAVAYVVVTDRLLWDALIVGCFVLGIAAARIAFTAHAKLPPAESPSHPVLFFNPKSGGGKAERFALADEAAARGIEAVELRRDDDLEQLARSAVERGADALAAAGGDGTQAIVAAVAAEEALPFACIPAGTRNHFALDLGVDRDDVIGALDAFVSGGERLVDLAEVNGQVFVNNVSLGIYAEAVQRDEYRGAKLRTLLDTVPDVLGSDGESTELRWRNAAGREVSSNAVILVSNNRYRLGRLVASGTRPRLDEQVLGVTALEPATGGRALQPVVHDFTTPTFEVAADGPVPAGIDGEAVMLDPPLRFAVRPGALRVRVADAHPGASPSAMLPSRVWDSLRALCRIAAGR